MHIHILGICGTFMGGIAAIAKESGHTVTGCDQNVYPPMSTQLLKLGIELHQGYDDAQIDTIGADIYLIGNVMTRGMPIIERLLKEKRPLMSAPQWLGENILRKQQKVLAVAGTHGKTTTTSMLAWILEDNQLDPGFLIGGVPLNFNLSARLGAGKYFVIEADEYDTAFFDKRSKFIHYRPDILILNNLEFDHADIFTNLADIERQFHHLLKIVPADGNLIANANEPNLLTVLNQGYWSTLDLFGDQDARRNADWSIKSINNHKFQLQYKGTSYSAYNSLPGIHNQFNLTGAIVGAAKSGVDIEAAIDSATRFQAPRRRLEKVFENTHMCVYDDFAHHPTAILHTINTLKRESNAQLVVVFEAGSNSMRSGAHDEGLKTAFTGADKVVLFCMDDQHSLLQILRENYPKKIKYFCQFNAIISYLGNLDNQQTNIVFMSNTGFSGLISRFIQFQK